MSLSDIPTLIQTASTTGIVDGGVERFVSEVPAVTTILIADGQEISRRLIKSMLRAGQHKFIEASTGLEALERLEKDKVDLIIVDIMVPGLGGPELCRYVRANRKLQFVPILMLTSLPGFDYEVQGLESGADEYLAKPLHPAVVRARVTSLIRHKVAIDSLEEAETILFALAQAVESRDLETGAHCQRLAACSVALGVTLGLPRADLVALYRGGFLHDIGKVSVPDSILLGKHQLNSAEWEIMKQHTLRGEDICRPMKSLAPVLPIIRSHHERWDGSGYPDGLKGEEIPLLARILQVVDIYDALTAVRPYKRTYTEEEALRVLEEESSKGWRDPELVALFVSIQRGTLLGSPQQIEQEYPELSPMLQSLTNMNHHLRE